MFGMGQVSQGRKLVQDLGRLNPLQTLRKTGKFTPASCLKIGKNDVANSTADVGVGGSIEKKKWC
jgi:hypothetical protein